MPMNPRLMRPLAGVPSGTPASLLLRFDGTNGSTSFVDSSPNGLTVTAYGDAEISTAQSKFGGASGYFANAGYVETGTLFDFAAGDWTIEFWLFADNTQLDKHIVSNIGAVTTGINIYLDSVGALAYNNGVATTTCTTPFTAWDEWAHVALVRESGVISLFLNGVLAGAATSQTPGDTQYLRIGASLYEGYEFTGYIDDFRIVQGLAVYTGPFIPPSAPLSPYAKQVAVSRQASLLLHMDGSNGSTTFTDSSQNALTVTANGDAEISTAESKWGGASGLFDGDGDSIITETSAAFAFAGPFTIECWIWASSWPTYCWLTDFRDGGAFTFGFQNGTFYPYLGDTDWAGDGDALPTEEWVHVAFVYDGTDVRMYANGVLYRTVTEAGKTQGNCAVAVASRYTQDSEYFDGYIDDLRIVKGLAVYTGPFVPPAGPLPAVATPQPIQAQASLLLHFDGSNGSTTFTDSSQNALTVTASGNAEISTAQSKWGGASGTFNDTDAYLTLDYTAPLAIGESSAFTVEAWVRPDATQTAGPGGGGNAGAILSTRNAAVYAPYELSIRNDLTLNVLIENAGNWQIAQQSATALVADEWSHIALVNDNGSLTLYINGVADATITNLAITPYAPAGPLTVYVGTGGDGYFNGYIDDLRIVKGLAVYTSNFTPPTGPLGATVTPQ